MQTIGTIGFMAGIPLQYTAHYRSGMLMVAETIEHFTRRGETVGLAFPTTTDHAQARNQLADVAIEHESDWLFLADCDQTFDPLTVVHLVADMEAHTLDVITGMYFLKGRPYLPVIYTYVAEVGGFRQICKFPRETVFQVEGTGGGCLLIRTSVLRRIKDELGLRPFDNRYTDGAGWLMEDLSFALNCRDLGIAMWCDPRVESRHIHQIEIGYAEFDSHPYEGATVDLTTHVAASTPEEEPVHV